MSFHHRTPEISTSVLALGAFGQATLTCACCNDDTLWAEEMARSHPTEFDAPTLDAVERRYGGPVCGICAEEVTICEQCGEVAEDDTNMAAIDDRQFVFCCEDCMAEWSQK
ncbi:hypothetical protein CLG85_001500 [Yangia mangrovi]|uniref:TRASH domain-containing protein n=1 Tax=Alloyangia mangrovi TaxID=1779329 RepID=A0A2A3K0Y3_9RHOB|nr:hypothetical protein [Alloyangia mangrovi]MCT4369084.1 hypothetical protein [Alloyangia mangrovi]